MYNKVILIGRLVADPELHKTSTDKSVARATLAVNRRYKDQNGEREADFITLVVWGKLERPLSPMPIKGAWSLWTVSFEPDAMRRMERPNM